MVAIQPTKLSYGKCTEMGCGMLSVVRAGRAESIVDSGNITAARIARLHGFF